MPATLVGWKVQTCQLFSRGSRSSLEWTEPWTTPLWLWVLDLRDFCTRSWVTGSTVQSAVCHLLCQPSKPHTSCCIPSTNRTELIWAFFTFWYRTAWLSSWFFLLFWQEFKRHANKPEKCSTPKHVLQRDWIKNSKLFKPHVKFVLDNCEREQILSKILLLGLCSGLKKVRRHSFHFVKVLEVKKYEDRSTSWGYEATASCKKEEWTQWWFLLGDYQRNCLSKICEIAQTDIRHETKCGKLLRMVSKRLEMQGKQMQHFSSQNIFSSCSEKYTHKKENANLQQKVCEMAK